MKINEIIVEAKHRAKLRQSVNDAIPDLKTWNQLDNNNCPYMAYRFGIALAPSPGRNDMPINGAFGSKFTTVGYSDADDEILAAAARAFGVKPTIDSDPESSEADLVNTQSPVKARGPIALKKKK